MGAGTRQRRLAAIMAADVAGYSKLMGDDEDGTRARFVRIVDEVVRPAVADVGGRVVNVVGDAFVAEFASSHHAVEAALRIQDGVEARQSDVSNEMRIRFRIGINVGDVAVGDGDIYGDGVNLAARIEKLARPGGVAIADSVYRQVRPNEAFAFEALGEQRLKNIAEPIHVYQAMRSDGRRLRLQKTPRLRRWAGQRSVWAVTLLVVVATALGTAVAVRLPLGSLWADGAIEAASVDVMAMPEGPTIAVLPFQNLSNGSNDEIFATTLTQDLITDLSRFDEVAVIALNSVLTYQGTPKSHTEIAAELGADFLLLGNVWRSGEALRVSAQLIDGGRSRIVWANRYDRVLDVASILFVLDEIRAEVVNAVAAQGGGAVSIAAVDRARQAPPASVGAFECVALAHHHILTYSAESHLRARDCLEATVEREPGYADAWAWLAHLYDDEYVNEFNTRPDALGRARAAALHAIKLDPKNQKAHAELAVNSFFQHDHDRFRVEAETALALNPNNAAIFGDLAIFMVGIGEWERGYAMAQKAARLDPHGTIFYFPIFRYHYHRRDYAAALEAANRIAMDDLSDKWRAVAAAAAQLGQDRVAAAAVARLLELEPGFPNRAWERIGQIIHDDAFVAHLIEGLRKAGLDIPERGVTDA